MAVTVEIAPEGDIDGIHGNIAHIEVCCKLNIPCPMVIIVSTLTAYVFTIAANVSALTVGVGSNPLCGMLCEVNKVLCAVDCNSTCLCTAAGNDLKSCIIERCGDSTEPCSIYVVLVIKAVKLACKLSCKNLNGKLRADSKVLILITCALLHLECKSDCVSLTCKQLAGGFCADSSKNLGECAETSKLCHFSACESKLACSVVYVDHVSKLRNCACSSDAELILESKSAGIADLDVLSFYVTGLPKLVIKDCAFGSILVSLLCTGCSCVLPLHSYIECTGLDNVSGAGHGVGKPRIGGTDQHGYAQQQGKYAQQKRLFSAILFHFNKSSNRHLIYLRSRSKCQENPRRRILVFAARPPKGSGRAFNKN